MDIDELRAVSAKKQQNQNRTSELITYLGSAAIVLVSLSYLGYSYLKANEAPQQTLVAAAQPSPQNSGKSVDDVFKNSFAAKVAQRSGRSFVNDVYGVPSAKMVGKPGSVFAQDYQTCQEEWRAAMAEKRKKDGGLSFGLAIMTKQMGGRSKDLARLIKCVSHEKRMARLCNDDYRAQFSKLVTKFMKSGKTSSGMMALMQHGHKKNFEQMSPQKREAYFKSMELGPFNPGYIRIKELIAMGYLDTSEYKSFFHTPKWVAKLEPVQGDHERLCANT